MADGTAKPVIFISYSHKDRTWLEYVRSFLNPLSKHGTLTIWDDEKLQIGDDWKGDIYSALDACSIFIVLVSRYSLASDFIIDEEVGRILKRPKGEVRFCPIVVSPCHMPELDWLNHPNRRPKDGKALSELPDPERDREMAVITGQIANALITSARTAGGTTSASPVAVSFPAIVDYARLPETPYKHLVGRESEIRHLDDAWADRKINIVSLIAWGGAGKTALVNEWLMRLRNDNYRGADAVLGWSFYSQGTKERATSAEGFLDWALGKLNVKVETTSSSVKAEKLAEALARRRVLLVLDGLEPLQYGPEGQKGALKDQGLRAFLRGFAAMPPATTHGLVALTSRLPVLELQRWKDDAAPIIDLARLSDEAGAALLTDNGVKGAPKALQDAAHDFAGHALALSLLASFLSELYRGDVRQRDRIRGLLADADNPSHDHAERVMDSYEKEWLAGQPVLLAIMYMVGLFDRPASSDCLNALRSEPAIAGLTDQIVKLDDREWQRAVARLREVRLLAPPDPAAPDALDAHPLVREWFGERLKATNEKAWRAAHGRLFEHLRDTTKEGDTPTLEDLAPLYQAIAHGCRASRHQEALDKIYIGRICRRQPDGEIVFYASKKLGALGSDLAAISWFFDQPYAMPVAALKPLDQSWVTGQAALRLRAQGRFAEALPADRAALRMAEDAEDWRNAAIRASNLSQDELLVGEIAAAVPTAEQSVAFADRSGDEFWMMGFRTTYADALHAAGRREEAAQAFADAERRQKEQQPEYPLLYSLQGYRYCDLLLSEGDHTAARDRATQTVKWARQLSLLAIALDTLTVGRAHLGLAPAPASNHQMSAVMRDDARAAHARLDEAVDRLRAAGTSHHVPRGLLARATFRRSIGDWGGAARDLDEVEEIAEPGPMRLYLCEMALERARLAFAKIEAFAPLNGMLEKDNPPKPAVPSADEIAKLKSEAEDQLKIAADYIEKCGYHRRDEDLGELQAVLRGEKKFADLPPRV
jgi:TIR domain